MAAAMKLFLVVVALISCMQFVEMARIRRDEPAAAPAFDLNAILEQIKNSDVVKQFQGMKPEQFTQKIQEGINSIKEGIDKNVATMQPEVQEKLKTLQGDFEQNKGKAENALKDIMETLAKNFAPAKTA